MNAKIEAATLALVVCACGTTAGATRSVEAPEVENESRAVETIDVALLRSESLQRTAECVSSSLPALVQVAPGFRPLDPEDPSSPGMGRSYDIDAVRLGRARPAVALEELLMNVFRPDPMDFVFYKHVDPMPTHSAGAIEEALVQVRSEMSDQEQAAVRTLAARVESCAGDALGFYQIEAGFSDAVGTARHGIALVDEASGEALWLYSVAAWST
jgi:hypothetical protein